MTVHFRKQISVEKDLGGVHRQLFRQVFETGVGAHRNVFGPRAVVKASAIVWARHLAITRVEITALTQSEAVSRVGTQELFVVGLHERHEGSLASVDQPTVDGLNVTDEGVIVEVVWRIDRLEPDHLAVALDRVSGQEEFRNSCHIRRKSKRVPVDAVEVVDGQVDLGQANLLEEGVRHELRNFVVVDEEGLDGVGNVVRPEDGQSVKADVEFSKLQLSSQVEVVAQVGDLVVRDVQPPEVEGQHGVVELADLVR